MNRQEQFEEAYADAHDMPLETFHQYRMGDSYRLPMIAKCWRFWQMGVEAGVNGHVQSAQSERGQSALVAQLQSDLTDRDEEIDELRSAGQPAGEGV